MWRLVRNPLKSAEQAETERGAISILVALLSVALIVIVAMVADAGMVYAERAQLQNGADSAALAVAGKCSMSGSVCDQATANTLAAGLTNGNANDGAGAVVLDFSVSGQVTATTTTVDGASHAGFLSLPLGSLTGLGKATVNAKATAVWGGIFSGATVLPITFGTCQVTQNMRDVADGIVLEHGNDKCSSDNPSGQNMPGGFGWLAASTGCTINISVGQVAPGDPGASVSNNCTDTLLATLNANIGKKVLVPIFSAVTGSGKNAKYTIAGWGVFVLKGWNFSPGQFKNGGSWPGGKGNVTGFYGHFTEIITNDSAYTHGGTTQYGASEVHLTN